MCSFCWNFSERKILWSLCSVDFHTLTLQLQNEHTLEGGGVGGKGYSLPLIGYFWYNEPKIPQAQARPASQMSVETTKGLNEMKSKKKFQTSKRIFAFARFEQTLMVHLHLVWVLRLRMSGRIQFLVCWRIRIVAKWIVAKWVLHICHCYWDSLSYNRKESQLCTQSPVSQLVAGVNKPEFQWRITIFKPLN